MLKLTWIYVALISEAIRRSEGELKPSNWRVNFQVISVGFSTNIKGSSHEYYYFWSQKTIEIKISIYIFMQKTQSFSGLFGLYSTLSENVPFIMLAISKCDFGIKKNNPRILKSYHIPTNLFTVFDPQNPFAD